MVVNVGFTIIGNYTFNRSNRSVSVIICLNSQIRTVFWPGNCNTYGTYN